MQEYDVRTTEGIHQFHLDHPVSLLRELVKLDEHLRDHPEELNPETIKRYKTLKKLYGQASGLVEKFTEALETQPVPAETTEVRT